MYSDVAEVEYATGGWIALKKHPLFASLGIYIYIYTVYVWTLDDLDG